MKHASRLRKVLGIAALLALAACGGGGSSAPSTTATVGVSGATVSGPDGVQVVVPPGAVDGDTQVTITRSSAGAPAVPEAYAASAVVYEFQPHGITFREPVLIRLPRPSGATGNTVLVASAGEDWNAYEATPNGNMLEFERNTFSWGTVIAACSWSPNDPHINPSGCILPHGYASAEATPAQALTVTARNWANVSPAVSYRLSQSATVTLRLNYTAQYDCGGTQATIQRRRTDIKPEPAYTTIYSGSAPASDNMAAAPFRKLSGSLSVAQPFTSADNGTHEFKFTFRCTRPGRPTHTGVDTLAIVSDIAAPSVVRSIGGTVSGLAGSGLVLQNNGSDDLSVAADGPFTFAAAVPDGSTYNVTVKTQPAGQTCNVQGASGTATADVSTVQVSCVPTPPPPSGSCPDGKIAAGAEHTCAVRADGGVACWGSGSMGELGNGTSDNRAQPTRVSTLTSVKSVAAGGRSSCAIDSADMLWCWGEQFDALMPARVFSEPIPVKGVAIGWNHACLINAFGGHDEVACWGANDLGQLGTGSTTNENRPATVRYADGSPLRGAVAVVAGNLYSCAQLQDNSVWCWGTDLNTQPRVNPQRILRRLPSQQTMDFTVAGRIAGGLNHACALESGSGQPLCWGFNPQGQLGDGTTNGNSHALTVGPFGALQVVAGSGHSCAITTTDVQCWGTAHMGNGAVAQTLLSADSAAGPATLANLPNPVIAGAAGERHTCVLQNNGNVQCWGENSSGQIGNNAAAFDALTPSSTTEGAVFWRP